MKESMKKELTELTNNEELINVFTSYVREEINSKNPILLMKSVAPLIIGIPRGICKSIELHHPDLDNESLDKYTEYMTNIVSIVNSLIQDDSIVEDDFTELTELSNVVSKNIFKFNSVLMIKNRKQLSVRVNRITDGLCNGSILSYYNAESGNCNRYIVDEVNKNDEIVAHDEMSGEIIKIEVYNLHKYNVVKRVIK